MDWSKLMNLKGRRVRARSILFAAFLLLGVALADCHAAYAIPAFARKYGMPCSSCHEAWPNRVSSRPRDFLIVYFANTGAPV